MKELKQAIENARDIDLNKSDIAYSDHSNDFKQMYANSKEIRN